MGLYLEPEIDKKDWLDANGELETETIGFSNIDFRAVPDNQVLVCNVNNGFFYASAVAYNEAEFKAFDAPDGRPKSWYLLDKAKAKPIAPGWESYFKD